VKSETKEIMAAIRRAANVRVTFPSPVGDVTVKVCVTKKEARRLVHAHGLPDPAVAEVAETYAGTELQFKG